MKDRRSGQIYAESAEFGALRAPHRCGQLPRSEAVHQTCPGSTPRRCAECPTGARRISRGRRRRTGPGKGSPSGRRPATPWSRAGRPAAPPRARDAGARLGVRQAGPCGLRRGRRHTGPPPGRSKLRGGSLRSALRAPVVGPPSAGAAPEGISATAARQGGATRNPQSLVRSAQSRLTAGPPTCAAQTSGARNSNLRPATSRRAAQGHRRVLAELPAVGVSEPAQVQEAPPAGDVGDRGGVRGGRLQLGVRTVEAHRPQIHTRRDPVGPREPFLQASRAHGHAAGQARGRPRVLGVGVMSSTASRTACGAAGRRGPARASV